MEILSWFGIFCIVYAIIGIITFGDVISEAGLEGDDNPLMFVFFIFIFGLACMVAVFWPLYWYVKVKDRLIGDRK